ALSFFFAVSRENTHSALFSVALEKRFGDAEIGAKRLAPTCRLLLRTAGVKYCTAAMRTVVSQALGNASSGRSVGVPARGAMPRLKLPKMAADERNVRDWPCLQRHSLRGTEIRAVVVDDLARHELRGSRRASDWAPRWT